MAKFKRLWNNNLTPQVLTLSISALGVHSVALAEDEVPTVEKADKKAGVEEVVVTARKIEENMQDVPVTVSTYSSEDIKNFNIVTASDVATLEPNLQVNSAFGGGTMPNFVMRGISVANEYNANQASPIAVYSDDVYMAARYTHGLQLFDTERLEVLKGPQGTLYGQNSTGGAIKFISTQPSLEGTEGYVKTTVGQDQLLELEGAVEATAPGDKVGLRVAFVTKSRDPIQDNYGFDDNNQPIEELDSSDSNAYRAIMKVQATDSLDFVTKFYSGKNDGINPAPVSFGSLTAQEIEARYSYTPGGDLSAGSTYNAGAYSRLRPVNVGTLGFHDGESNREGEYNIEQQGASFTVNWSGETIDIVSISAYEEGEFDIKNDPDGSPLNLLHIDWFSDYRQYSQEVRAFTVQDNYTAQVGLFVNEDNFGTANFYRAYGEFTHIPFGTSVYAPFTLAGSFDQQRKSQSVFGETTYDLTNAFAVTFGARFTKDETTYSNGSGLYSDITRTVPPIEMLGALPPSITGTENKWSGKASVDYKLADDKMVYLSLSHGFRSGAFNGTGFLSDTQIYYVKPETVNSVELGLKSRWLDNQIQFNGALFNNDYKNQQAQEVIGLSPYLVNIPESTIKGFEGDLLYQASTELRLRAALGVQISEYGDFIYQRDEANPSVFPGVNIGGNQMMSVPEFNVTFGGDYQLFSADFGALYAHIDFTYTDEQWFSPRNELDPNQYQEGYWLANTKFMLEGNSYAASLWVKNLTDEEYYSYGIDLKATIGVDYLSVGEARTVGADFTYYF